MIDRKQAWQIVCEFTKSENLRKHSLAVETCVVAYARKFGEDEHKWSVTALLHDFDWEIHPQAPDHPMNGEPILAERGVPEEIRRAILSHANYSGVPRTSLLEKALFACDELAGFITALSYVKPGRSVFEVDAPSVRKKVKDKAFARSVNRRRTGAGHRSRRAHHLLCESHAGAGRGIGSARDRRPTGREISSFRTASDVGPSHPCWTQRIV
jgi:putative nucleotidyltransferase with HDIG domain